MKPRTEGALAVLTIGLLIGTAAHVHAAEIGLLEMLFGARPAAEPAQVSRRPDVSEQRGSSSRADQAKGSMPRRLSIRYTALPVRVRVVEKSTSDRQVAIDMSGGAAAALMKDETLRQGDIVILKSGARVFTGDPNKRHAMRDFEPVQSSAHVDKSTRRLLVGMMAPVGALPADEARRVMARSRNRPVATDEPVSPRVTAMRIINPWQTDR